jgi:prepilin-type N-terminal cleavage/methylation domain-containing protein
MTTMKPQRGFTLIEILVVMIIMGMVSGILFQALASSYRLQQRFGAELFTLQHRQMATDWYRQTIQGLRPDYPDGPHRFNGSAQTFSGLTDNALRQPYGLPTAITWQLVPNPQAGATELQYQEGAQATPILSWPHAQAHFVYIDDKRDPHDTWPPPLGSATQLPSQIQIVTRQGPASSYLIATPVNTASPPLRLKDL